MINEDAGQTVLFFVFFFLSRLTFFSQLFLKRKVFFSRLTINKDGLIT